MIQSNPLLERSFRLQAQKATGILHLSDGSEEVEVYFYDGYIDSISSNLQELRLGQYLIRHAGLDEEALSQLREQARKNSTPLGEEAVRQRRIEPPQLSELLIKEVVELYHHALVKKFTIDRFEQTTRSFLFPLRIRLERILLELARLRSVPLNLPSGEQVVLKEPQLVSGLPWKPREISLLSQLDHPNSLEELVDRTNLEESEVKRILNIFKEMGILEISNGRPFQSMTALARRERLPLEMLVPEFPNAYLNGKLEVVQNENSFISEQFRSLKVRLNEIEAQEPLRVLSVTSPNMQDGKSLIAANLALCFARDPGRRVLLVDCDLRDSNVHKSFGTTIGPGLYDYLLTENLAPQCFLRRFDGLFVMTSGRIAENPVELLSLSRMKKLIAFFKEQFDTIILDSPPLMPIADARIVSRLADATMMVVRRGKTPFDEIEKALRLVEQRKFLGVIFNDVKAAMFSTYYSYGYYQYGRTTGYPAPSKSPDKGNL